MTKSMEGNKKYGEPYERKELLRSGDMRLIAKITGYSYISVVQQINGTRAIRPDVKAAADKLADNNQQLIDRINKLSIDE